MPLPQPAPRNAPWSGHSVHVAADLHANPAPVRRGAAGTLEQRHL